MSDGCLSRFDPIAPASVLGADSSEVNLAIRRITIAVLAAALAGAVLAVPASSNSGPAAVAKKKAKKC